MTANGERALAQAMHQTGLKANMYTPETAKSALEADTRVLAYEAGQKYGVRVNTISAGPLKSRAASAISKA